MRAPIDRPHHCHPPKPPKAEKPTFTELDANGDGSISEQEFTVREGENPLALKKAEMKRRGAEFDKLDLNSDGKISRMEHVINEFRESRNDPFEAFDNLFPRTEARPSGKLGSTPVQDMLDKVLPDDFPDVAGPILTPVKDVLDNIIPNDFPQ